MYSRQAGDNRPLVSALRYILAALLAVLLLVVLRFGDESLVVWRWAKYLIPFGVMLAGLGVMWVRDRSRDRPEDELDGWGIAIILTVATVVYLFSSAATHFYYFFAQHEDLDAKMYGYRSVLEQVGIAAAVLTPLFFFRRKPWWTAGLGLGLIACVVATGLSFFEATGGDPIYRDDHPAFLLRFNVFAETFPQILYYNPWWNGGKSASYLVTSGSLGPGIFFWPIWKFGNVESTYSTVLFFYACVMTPLIGMWSVRLIGGRWMAAIATALLCLCATRHYHLWLLHYGTIGFTFSMPFLLLAAAALYRVLWLDMIDWRTGVILVASSFFFLSWPAAVPMGLPLVVAALVSLKQFSMRKTYFLAACGFVIALLLMPHLNAILNHSRAADLAASESARLTFDALFVEGGGVLVERLRNGHPLILFFGIAGVFFLRIPGFRLFYGAMVVTFLLEVSVLGQIKPQAELKRAAVPLFFLAAVPAGFWIDRLFRSKQVWAHGAQAVVAVLLVLGGWNNRTFFSGERLEKFDPKQPYIDEFIDWVGVHVPEQGRLAFAGPTRHAFSGAHVAMLPLQTGREMMAVDYYSFSEKLVPYNFPPYPWGKTTRGTIDYYQLYGVSHVVAYEEHILRFYRKTPEVFQEVFEFGTKRKFVVFAVNLPQINRFHAGAGSVASGINELRVEITSQDQDVVLRYHWEDGLKSTGNAELFKQSVGDGIDFIGIRPHGESEVTISYEKMW